MQRLFQGLVILQTILKHILGRNHISGTKEGHIKMPHDNTHWGETISMQLL